MSPTPAPRVVAGGVASSFRNRSAIEQYRYRSDSLWPRWNLFLWIGCDIPSYTPIVQPWDARSRYGIAISGTAMRISATRCADHSPATVRMAS
jgi:hypothetical protein